jgi:hypothetical protein
VADLLAIFDAYSGRNAVLVQSGECPWCLGHTPHAHALGTLLITFPEGRVPRRAEPLEIAEEVHGWSSK